MKIYGDETLKRRRLLSLPGITLLFLVSAKLVIRAVGRRPPNRTGIIAQVG